ncbi:MAG: hypothetical protein LBG15_07030 [Dysgonamonadaceae bacterium]|jgi:hypothetical protein|nr:hypothetical protein [Dysgonamonadaceae bacterium]
MKKQLFSFVFVMTAASACFLSSDLYAFNGSGSGTPENPYVITTATQLAEVKNDLNAHYKLGADIDLTDWIAANSPTAGWEPIGFSGSNDVAEATPFRGTFDGDGHTISGLWIDRPDNKFIGLFGQISGETTFKNLGIVIPEGKSIKGNENVGAIGGWFTNADATNMTIINNVFVSGKIEGTKAVGALVGLLNWTSATIENTYAAGEIAGYTTGDGIGGLIGSTWGNLMVNLSKSYATNVITSSVTSGSLAGLFGSTSANNAAGINITVSNCVAANPFITGGNNVQRILAYAKSGTQLTFINNYAYVGMLLNGAEEWFGALDNNGGADIEASALIRQSSYATWDFDGVWQMGNSAYQLPVLKTLNLASQPTVNPAYLGGTSINGILLEKLDVQYADGILNILNKTSGSIVKVYSVTGALILSGIKDSYDISSLPNGVYLVKIDNGITKILK